MSWGGEGCSWPLEAEDGMEGFSFVVRQQIPVMIDSDTYIDRELRSWAVEGPLGLIPMWDHMGK